MSDRVAALVCAVAAMTCLATFGWILLEVLGGIGHLRLSFLFDMPRDAGRSGGIAPMIVSSFLLTAIAWVTCVPVGLLAAASLVHGKMFGWQWLRWLDVALDLLAGSPSIVFGLFGNALFCVTLGLGFSLLSGGLTLACMILPLFVRTAQIGLQNAAELYYRPAVATGLGQWTILLRVLLPGAWPAIAAGLALATARALAETAALIFTSGYVDRMPRSLFDSGRSISVHIYDLTMNVAGGDDAARTSALILVIVLVLINSGARMVLHNWLDQRQKYQAM